MTFSQEVKNEIAGHLPGTVNSTVAGLAALISCIGRLELHRDVQGNALYDLKISTDNALASRKCFTLLEKTANIIFEFGASKMLELPAEVSFSEFAPQEVIQEIADLLDILLPDGSIREESMFIPWELLADEDSVREFLGDIFLCSGSITDPDKGYDLEFVCRELDQAVQIQKILMSRGISVKQTRRRKQIVVYTRESEAIADILNLMGAPIGMMNFENAKIRRAVRGGINRKVNCETANIAKAVTAARRQIDDILLVRNSEVYDTLSAALREIARVRIENPDVSLTELGSLLDPPVGKSGVNHRLRKLSELAAELRDGSDDK